MDMWDKQKGKDDINAQLSFFEQAAMDGLRKRAKIIFPILDLDSSGVISRANLKARRIAFPLLRSRRCTHAENKFAGRSMPFSASNV